jgi:hypothetical protein
MKITHDKIDDETKLHVADADLQTELWLPGYEKRKGLVLTTTGNLGRTPPVRRNRQQKATLK